MKKETVILYVVIAFIVGFITGATVAILKGKKDTQRPAMMQKPQMAPQVAEAPEPQGPNPMEVAAKVQALKDIVKKDPKNLSAWVELGNLCFDSSLMKHLSYLVYSIRDLPVQFPHIGLAPSRMANMSGPQQGRSLSRNSQNHLFPIHLFTDRFFIFKAVLKGEKDRILFFED